MNNTETIENITTETTKEMITISVREHRLLQAKARVYDLNGLVQAAGNEIQQTNVQIVELQKQHLPNQQSFWQATPQSDEPHRVTEVA